MSETVFKRIISMILVVILLLSCIPVNTLAIDLNSRDTATWTDAFRGKTLSILGDSISTYKDHSNGAAAKDTNTTIQNGAIYYPRSGFDVTAESTWWYQAARELGMEILVNNSWSGSCLLNTRSGTVGAYVDRCVQLHDNTGDDADRKPDIIAIFLGTNDYYTYPNTLGTYESIDFDGLITEGDNGFLYAEPTTSMEAYAISLHKIGQAYPDAEVYCFTLLPRVNSSSQPTAFNEDICQLAEKFGAYTVDLYDCGIQSESTAFYKMMGDNLHPDNPGMDAITNAFVSELLKNSELTTHDISFALEGAVSLEGTRRTVVSGESFEAVLAPLDASLPLEVTVTMGGVDITESCWENSVVTIPVVTADVVITAKPGQREPLNFRWETREDAFVSVTSGGNTANDLTMTHGSITDGVFSKTRFTMSQGISLRHDLPWCVEWKSSGTWTDTTDGALLFSEAASSSTADAYYFYRRHNNDFFAFGSCTGGKYHNYGVKFAGTGIDTTAEHVFRLENRIAADGSNMVWLLVDGEDVGPLNHHYIGGTDQKETVDWVSGKDFTFSYMGTNPHTIGGCSLEYVQVWENYHTHTYTPTVTAPTCTEQGYTTYTCECGDSYVANYVDATGHTYENGACTDCEEMHLWKGKSAVFVGDSITAGVGTTETYYEILNKSVGFSSVTGMGVAGSCISAASDYGQSNQPLINRYQNIPSADLIVIFMGTNDYGHETPLGSVKDTQDGTFYGTLNVIIPALAAKHPVSKIVFVTPMHRYGFGTSKILGTKFTYDNLPNGVGATLGDYVEALKTVCAKNGVSVIDLYTELTWNPADAETREKYIPDGLHPNEAGHIFVAEILESHIRNYEPAEGGVVPDEETDLVYGNRFASGFTQENRASSRINLYLKAGTVITLKNPDLFQWACVKTSNENSSDNLGYFPDSAWSDKETAVVETDGWIGFVFKCRDETETLDVSRPLTEYISIHTHSYTPTVTAPTCTEQGYTTYTCECGDSYAADHVEALGHTTVIDAGIKENSARPGVTEGSHCSACGEVLEAQQEIPAKGYDWMLEDGEFKILLIGNSFSQDASSCGFGMTESQLYNMLQAMLGDDVKVTLGLLYSGGKGVHWYATQTEQGTKAPSFYTITPEKTVWTSWGGTSTETAITWTDWDVVTLQPYDVNFAKEQEGVPEKYKAETDEKFYPLETATEYMLDFIGTHAPQADVYCYMHWARSSATVASLNAAFSTYQKFAAFYPKGLDYLGTETGNRYAGIIPVGLSIQNARTTYLSTLSYNIGSTVDLQNDPQIGLQRDGGHVTFNVGRYIAGLTFAETLIPVGLRAEGYVLPGIRVTESVGKLPEEYTVVAQKAVFAAVESWRKGSLEVTNLEEYAQDPTVSAREELESMTLNLTCGDDNALIAQIREKVLGELSAEFVVEAVAVDVEKNTAVITLRFGYTSVEAEMAYTLTNHNYENGTCALCGAAAPSPYAGKTIACIGDSITYGVGVTRDQTDYVTLLAKSLEMDYIRLGASGTTLCTDGHATCNIRKLTEANLAGADVVTILMGINDFVQAKNGYYSLGTIDSTDTSTIYGALHMWCQRIEELRQTDSLKDTEFYFMTPVITSWNNSVSSARNWDQGKVNIHGYTLRDLCNAVIEVCALYDIPVIDLNLLSGLYYNSPEDNSIAQFGGDGAHPGEIGHQMMANAIENVLLQNNLRDDHDHSYGSWITTTYPDCESGEQQRVCAVCAATERKMLDGKGHAYENGVCTGCGKELHTLPLRYDDHVDMTGKTVEILDGGTPTSYQVGYGVEENKVLDTTVVTLEGNTLVATGIGTAMVRIDGQVYEVNVTAAPISLLLIIGQSNAEGMEGNANQSVVCEDGQVYSTYAKSNGLTGDAGLTVENAGNYVPSALTGAYANVNVNGTDTKLSDYPVYSLTDAGAGKYGMDSGLAYEWVQQTGEKVWVVNAAHGGTSINTWQKGADNYDQAVALFRACQQVLQAEIAAGHYTFSHMGYYWNQGCADEAKTAEWYVGQYLAMHANLKMDLACDMDGNAATADNVLEFGNILLVQAGHSNATGYRQGVYEDDSDSFFMTYKELELRGPRVAQIWMANNPELTDIHIVSTLAQNWVTMPDGSDGVAEYFQTAYPDGTVDYTTQVKQSASWYTPTTPAAVKDTIHYNQIGYNEIGREAARNTLYILGILEKPQKETTVQFLNWTGYENADTIKTSGVATSDTLVVPLVYPCYESKTVQYTLSDGLTWSYYDLLDTGVEGGMLTASVGDQTVNVTAREFASYRFELVDGKLVCVSDDTFRENQLAATTAGTYTLTEPIVLMHNREWTVEFNSVASDRFMALASSKSTVEGMLYFFKSNSGTGVLAVGEYKDGLYQNYGLLQSQIQVDWKAPHVYRFENKINADGSNVIHIFVDNEWVGTATNLIINSQLQNTDNMYLSGKDLVFTSIGCSTMGLGNGQMTYLEVREEKHNHTYENGICAGCGAVDPDAVEPMALRYDDHVDMTGKTVEILDAGTPTSYQVGYGVAENAVPDTAVVTMKGNTLVATGIGTAMIRIDGTLYEVTVEAAPISLLLLIGQSNMRGSEGNADQSIVCPDGMVYATFGDDRGDAEGIMNVDNATKFAASALTGPYSTINVEGTTEHLSYYPINSLTEAGAGTFGPDSGFAYEWVQQTGEKVWVVNAAHGGSAISSWQPNATNFKEAVLLFQACQETLRKEIAAGHFTLSHMGYFWCQGCNDVSMTAEQYVAKYLTMHENLKSTLEFDHDSDASTDTVAFEFAGIIPILYGVNSYRAGEYKDQNTYTYYQSFEQLTFNGPRVAQYWMCNNPELADIWMVCNIGEDWVWMPDDTNGVSAYFQSHYENGTVDYTTQVAQKASWYTPTTPAAVHDSIHYNQIGYNEIGRESARNALIMLGEIAAPEVETTVELLSWDGYTPIEQISASLTGNSGTLVVPKVYPVWKSKEVTYTLSDNLIWSYYDLLVKDESLDGNLTMLDKTVTVKGHQWSEWMVISDPSPEGPGLEQRTCGDCGKTETRTVDGVWQKYALTDHLLELPENVCCATNLWSLLPHEDVHFTSGLRWGKVSVPAPSVTVPLNPGDRIYATSFLAAGDNGGPQNGIRLTFFNKEGVAWSVDPGTAYREWKKNGYIEAPEGTIAVNLPMWYDREDYEFYILSRDHIYENGICLGCSGVDPNLANYKGKVISIMGDSISTFEGYVPVADGYNREHLSRYPQDNLLTDVNETWWMQVVDQLDAKLGINESWRGSTLSGAVPVTTGDTGENAAMSNLIRIQNMGSNGTPDVILLYGGTNDLAHVSKVGTFDPLTAPTQADLVTKKWDNLADGFVHTLLRIRHFYPDATIVALLPTYTASYYSSEKLAQGNGVMAQICEHYGIPYVDLRDSGVTAGHLPDGIHPGEEGMDLITAAVLEVLLQQPMESGENQVWSVSHELTHVKASLGHYKGISQGKSFVENLIGENLTVTVTMGGVDITENVYADGTIFIEEVTGALVIRAEGEQKAIYADYLQQLPENFCSSTNLWTLLVHDGEYYTANGWGTHSSGKVRSVTIPITPGDRIWATSFQAAGANGSSVNGIRLTWFDTYGVLNSMSADKVYQEFLENGYVTAPEGAAAVNIVMWTDSDSNELYILNREHSYCDGYCAVCGIRQVSTFRILDTRCNRVETFTYEVGMTWKEWLNSKYNTGMGSCIAIWVSEGPDILGSNPYMDIYVNGDPVDYDALICETDDMELVRYN